MKPKTKYIVTTLIAGLLMGLVFYWIITAYDEQTATTVAAIFGACVGLTWLMTEWHRWGKGIVSALIIAGVLIGTAPQSAQARRVADGEAFTMPVGQVEAAAAAVGATVIWIDGTIPDRRCPACLVAIAVIIIVGAIWYAACKAKQRERQLPPE